MPRSRPCKNSPSVSLSYRRSHADASAAEYKACARAGAQAYLQVRRASCDKRNAVIDHASCPPSPIGAAHHRVADGELWASDGERWYLLSDDGPPPRLHSAMAYDRRRDRLVVYGGIKNREETFADLWEWDGQVWRQAQPAPASSAIPHAGADNASGSDSPEVAVDPGPRDHHAMVYDEARGYVLLFGGQDEDDDYPADTWAWDGVDWRRIATVGPLPRTTHRLIYDPNRRVVVLSTGWGTTGMMNDTWEWDGTRWLESAGARPPGLGASRIAYDRVRQQIVLFGGLTGNGVEGDTWVRIALRWMRLPITAPPARNAHGMAYDESRQRVIVYGGIGAAGTRLNDLWEWNGTFWTEIEQR